MLKLNENEIKKLPTTLLLGVLIHNKKISSNEKSIIEKELKERGALI